MEPVMGPEHQLLPGHGRRRAPDSGVTTGRSVGVLTWENLATSAGRGATSVTREGKKNADFELYMGPCVGQAPAHPAVPAAAAADRQVKQYMQVG